jgi:hypothetical protein
LKTASHWSGDWTFQANACFVQRIEQILRERFAGFEDDGFVQLSATPDNIDAGGFDRANGGLRDFRADAVAGNKSAVVGHIQFYRRRKK